MRWTRPHANPVDELVFQVKAARLPEPLREHRFHATRRWRFDVAWPQRTASPWVSALAVEVEGGVYVKGAHTRGAHFESDCEKYAEALIHGWRVLRVTPRHIRDGRALQWIETLLR